MILITGGTGLVGQCLKNALNLANLSYLSPLREELNLGEPSQIKSYLKQHNITCIVHLAAETNVDLCEIQRKHAITINYLSTQVIADFCAEQNIKLVFISTSGVLAGNGNFQNSEIDLPNPSNFYALTKFRSEEYIIRKCTNYLIIRAAWMIGSTTGENKKFAEKVSKQIFDNTPEIKAVCDLYGSITSGERLADLIANNITSQSQAIIHCASSTVCSRYDIAKHIQKHFNSKTVIKAVKASEFPLNAPRGFSEGLTSEIAELQFGYKSLVWEEELNNFLVKINAK
jgi:dTDP-4-dehydrorhamnose reductase